MSLVVVIVIANVIGSGVYKKVAPMAAELHSPGWVLIAWILGGIISLFGALCNAEVAGLLADTGGEYSYYQKIYNKKNRLYFWMVNVCSNTDSCYFIIGLYLFSISQ